MKKNSKSLDEAKEKAAEAIKIFADTFTLNKIKNINININNVPLTRQPNKITIQYES